MKAPLQATLRTRDDLINALSYTAQALAILTREHDLYTPALMGSINKAHEHLSRSVHHVAALMSAGTFLINPIWNGKDHDPQD